jgi:glycerophosphoryl diester phosphodiesterase
MPALAFVCQSRTDFKSVVCGISSDPFPKNWAERIVTLQSEDNVWKSEVIEVAGFPIYYKYATYSNGKLSWEWESPRVCRVVSSHVEDIQRTPIDTMFQPASDRSWIDPRHASAASGSCFSLNFGCQSGQSCYTGNDIESCSGLRLSFVSQTSSVSELLTAKIKSCLFQWQKYNTLAPLSSSYKNENTVFWKSSSGNTPLSGSSSSYVSFEWIMPLQAMQNLQSSTFLRLELLSSKDQEVLSQGFISLSSFLRSDCYRHIEHVSRGPLEIPLVSASEISSTVPSGSIEADFRVVNPWVSELNTICDYQSINQRALVPHLECSSLVGHRGLGKSYSPNPFAAIPSARENTLLSFLRAGLDGADMVEFDVILSKDRVPVIYHDFFVGVSANSEAGGRTNTHVGVHELPFQQIKQLKVLPAHPEPFTNPNQATTKPSGVFKLGSFSHEEQKGSVAAVDPDEERHDQDECKRAHCEDYPNDKWLTTVPSLEELLRLLPLWLAFNLEIKFPVSLNTLGIAEHRSFDLNMFLDTILDTLFAFAGPRRIFFSCFDADVARALHLKQVRYPVFFLLEKNAPYIDKRSLSLAAGAEFAVAVRFYLFI